MGKAAAALAATSRRDVALGPLVYRVSRVTTADLVMVGGTALLAAAEAGRSEKDDVARLKKVTKALLEAAKSPARRAELSAFKGSVVSAGVIACSTDEGKTWEAFTVTTDRREEDIAANRVHISSLLPGHENALVAAILDLSNGGRAAKALSSFLQPSPPRARPTGAPVRDGSVVSAGVESAPPASGARLPGSRRGADNPKLR